MKKNSIKIILIVIFLNISNNLYSEIKSSIIAEIGSKIITSTDLENEIKTLIFLSGRNLTQENINSAKNIAMNSLVKINIKKIEIEKFEITNYNQKDLENYISNVAKNLNVNKQNLKKKFKGSNISYEEWIEKQITELKWNSLIFQMYKNQIKLNSIEIDDALKKLLNQKAKEKEYNLSEIEIPLATKVEEINIIYNFINNNGFINAAKKYSISDSKQNNGEIGWFKKSSLSKIYVEKLNNLSKDAITTPIKSMESLIILKINQIKEGQSQIKDIEKAKNIIINQKKEDKLKLFSRSHLLSLENTMLINFK
ncbi:peptidylprolyl isomerase [Pelagibacteraceae bacterium]|nr:peptidylprolyl isomerase [Pelagibacteraceae bacterium]